MASEKLSVLLDLWTAGALACDYDAAGCCSIMKFKALRRAAPFCFDFPMSAMTRDLGDSGD
jgi:hypothetical protein